MDGQTKNIMTQYIRALLTIFVIMIHSWVIYNSQFENIATIFIRNICNISVPTFLYISGFYFNKIKYLNYPKNYLVRKIKRLIIPLLIWNLIYFALFSNFDIKSLLTFNTAPHLYYLCVLFQLILLTPVLLKYPKLNYIMLLLNIAHLFIYRYMWICLDVQIPFHYYLFTAWIVYYILGLNNNKLPKSSGLLFIILLLFEFVYNLLIYYNIGLEYTLSQMNLVNFIVSLTFITFINSIIKVTIKSKVNKIIKEIGDLSFGIFLSHMLVLKVVEKILGLFVERMLIISIIGTILTLIICYLTIKILIKINKLTINSKYINYILGV